MKLSGNMASHDGFGKVRQEDFTEMQTQKRFVFVYDRRVGDKSEIKLSLHDISNNTTFRARVKQVGIVNFNYAEEIIMIMNTCLVYGSLVLVL